MLSKFDYVYDVPSKSIINGSNLNFRTSRRSLISHDNKQMVIDAGQKAFGPTQCETCSAVYEIGNSSDEYFHQNFHNRFQNTLKFPVSIFPDYPD